MIMDPLRTFALLAAAVGSPGALAAGSGARGAPREGLCEGHGYMSLGWPGMSEDRCVRRAAEVIHGCSFVSYSASPGPQASSNFCRCFSGCAGDLRHPAGEVWETREVEVDAALLREAATPGKGGETLASTAATTTAMGTLGERQGICQGTAYMNIAWGGMSKDKCLDRASQVLQDTGRCAFVSYSASPWPQGNSNFCRCFASCAGDLQQPAGEVWETSEPRAASRIQVHLTPFVLAGVIVFSITSLLAAGCVVACIWRRRRWAAESSESDTAALGARPPEIENPVADVGF